MSTVKGAMLNVVAGLAANMAASSLADVLGKLTTAAAASVGVAGPVLPCGISMGEIASVAAYGTLLLGSTFIQVCQGKKADDSETRRIAGVEAAIRKLSTRQDEALGDLADLAIEQQWVREAIESPLGAVPGGFDAAWRGQVETGLKVLGAEAALIRKTLDDMRVVAFDTNARVRGLEVAADRHDGKLDEVLSENQLMRLAIERLAEQMASMQSSRGLEAENAKLSTELAATTERYLAAERALGRPWRAVIEELRGDPKGLVAFLIQQTEQDERDLIEKQRELASVCYVTGEIGMAVDALKKILALSPSDLDAMNLLGHVKEIRGDLEEASCLFKRVGELASDDLWQAISLGNLGRIEDTLGNLNIAQEYYQESLAIGVKRGYLEVMVACYTNLAGIARARDMLKEAEEYLSKSITINEKLGRLGAMATAYGNMGLIAQSRDDLDAAEYYLGKSIEIHEKLGQMKNLAIQYGNLGGIKVSRGELDAGAEYIRKSLAINEKFGRLEGMANQYGNLGLIEFARRKLDSAEDYLKKSLTINEKLGRLEGMATDYVNLGRIAEDRGDRAEARRFWTLSRDLWDKLGAKHKAGTVQIWLNDFQ